MSRFPTKLRCPLCEKTTNTMSRLGHCAEHQWVCGSHDGRWLVMNWGQECPTCKVKRDCRVCKINQHPENQPGDSANYPEISEKILIIPSASDFHVHFRQGDLMNMVVPRIVEGGISLCYVMPNLKPPITSTEQALVYRDKLEKLDPNVSFLMSLYLNPDLTPEEIRKAKEAGIVGVKLYPRGVTTNSDIGTESYKVYYPVFKTMEEVGMILNLHGEIPSDIEQDICVMNAEEKFLIHLKELHADFPELKIVLEHATTKAAVEMVKSLGDTVGCTITIHHLQLTVDDWAGQFHNFCKPVAKFPHDRQALRDVILEGHPRFFLGTDSAPHPAHHKECAQSCAGVFTTPLALPYLATILDSFNALHMLKSFACENGKKFYNIKEEKCREIKLIRENWLVPNSYPFCNTQEEKSGIVIPFWAGKTLTWKIDSN